MRLRLRNLRLNVQHLAFVGGGADKTSGDGKENVASTAKDAALVRDEAEVADDLNALDGNDAEKVSAKLGEDVDAGQEADAKVGEDKALEELVGVEFHGNARGELPLGEEHVEVLAAAALLGQEQVGAGELLHGDHLFVSKRVLGRSNEDEFVLVNHLDVQTGVLDRKGDNSEFDLAVEDRLDGFGTLGADDVEGNARVLALEVREEAGQYVESRRIIGADGKGAARGALKVAHGKKDMAEAAKGLFGKRLEDATGCGKGYLAAAAL